MTTEAARAMKTKEKRRSNRGDFMAWMLYDANGVYTGFTLWPSRDWAKAEKEHQEEVGNAPIDGKWRIRKVHVRFT